jgi:hypothetical protein
MDLPHSSFMDYWKCSISFKSWKRCWGLWFADVLILAYMLLVGVVLWINGRFLSCLIVWLSCKKETFSSNYNIICICNFCKSNGRHHTYESSKETILGEYLLCPCMNYWELPFSHFMECVTTCYLLLQPQCILNRFGIPNFWEDGMPTSNYTFKLQEKKTHHHTSHEHIKW